MQARFSTPSSLAAHHRRLMASCAESGCLQVRQRSGAESSARTVGESLCMSKSVEAYYKGQIVSARDLPTGCQQQCSLVVPTVRAPRHLTEPSAKSPQKQPTKRPERERRAGRADSGDVLQVDLVLPRGPIPGIGGASVRDHYVDPAGPAINPLIKMATIVQIMIISLIAIHS
jgi:hypothetical protein